MWYVYIAQARTGRYYTGISKKPIERIQNHNTTGSGAKFARDQGPFNLVYVSSDFKTLREARRRESQIKGWTREKKERLINGEWK